MTVKKKGLFCPFPISAFLYTITFIAVEADVNVLGTGRLLVPTVVNSLVVFFGRSLR
jgi:hypothetical protein